ncbi:hypothetical protein BKA69DRAFT_684947 [Paraphysoderma sedebokerense]|nr:hypothetical protein BKA69DRAFT_684947 [Paraphysoderma sedebokerense]
MFESTPSAFQLQYTPWRVPDVSLIFVRMLLALSVIGVITNTLLQIRFFKNRQNIRTSSMSIIHISTCDFLTLILVGVTSAALEVTRELSWYWCQVNAFCLIMLITPSSLTYTVIAIERYLRIIHGRSLTKVEMSLMIFTTWIISAGLAIIPVVTGVYFIPQASKAYCLGDFTGQSFGHRAYAISSSILIFIAFAIVTFCYYSVYKKAIADGFKWREQSFMSTKLPLILQGSNPGNANPLSNSMRQEDVFGSSHTVENGNPKPSKTVQSRHNDAYKTQMQLTIKLAAFTIYLYTVWSGTFASYLYQLITGQNISPEFNFIASFFTAGASAFNPILILKLDSRLKNSN